MNISIRLMQMMLAVLLLVGTVSIVFAAQCGYEPHLDANCNSNSCDLRVMSCSGTDKTSCEATWVSFNEKGAYACVYTGSKTAACVPAMGGVNGKTPLYSICMEYEQCSWQIMMSTCLPAGTWYDPCYAAYYMLTTC
jgi:hypothetical protein